MGYIVISFTFDPFQPPIEIILSVNSMQRINITYRDKDRKVPAENTDSYEIIINMYISFLNVNPFLEERQIKPNKLTFSPTDKYAKNERLI